MYKTRDIILYTTEALDRYSVESDRHRFLPVNTISVSVGCENKQNKFHLNKNYVTKFMSCETAEHRI